MGMLDGKVAIVTGAGRGIGRGHAMELARHGARVVVNDLGGSVGGEGAGRDADATVAIIEARGGEAVANYENVADHEGAGQMVAQAVDTYGRLDILVTNAGIVRDAAIWNMSESDFDAVIGVHLKGMWSPCHHAARHWRTVNKETGRPVGGRVITTTSGAGLVGNFGQTNYATAKAGVAGFTQTLSLELGRLGVTVNAVGPAAATRITATMPGAPPVIEPDDVAPDEWNRMDPAVSSPLVAWLASDESAHVTGQVIRAVAEDIILMTGWTNGAQISNGGQRWDATKLGTQLATDVFGTRAPGLRYC
jgi:NAD(P)-dependent dehydrogenase (short-subunit alcohol dehydrogenase family)